MSSAAAIDFETRIVNTLDACILKMSDRLNRNFDPADKQAVNLFRLFASAMRTRAQWVKQFFTNDLAAALKSAVKLAPKTKKGADVEKSKSSPKKESPALRCVIEKTGDSHAGADGALTRKGKINGLLMKR